jgi:hypothetical protein
MVSDAMAVVGDQLRAADFHRATADLWVTGQPWKVHRALP